jgi:hypothetical protein
MEGRRLQNYVSVYPLSALSFSIVVARAGSLRGRSYKLHFFKSAVLQLVIFKDLHLFNIAYLQKVNSSI